MSEDGYKLSHSNRLTASYLSFSLRLLKGSLRRAWGKMAVSTLAAQSYSAPHCWGHPLRWIRLTALNNINNTRGTEAAFEAELTNLHVLC